jgi:biopolymer transport protein ExbB/TolQ
MKNNNYFDRSKSLVENAYYLLMVVSIVFVVIQVVIARNSLDHSANLQLTQHTIEQDTRYRIAIEAQAESYITELRNALCATTGQDTLTVLLRIDSLIMRQKNLEEMTLREGMTELMLLPESLMATDPMRFEALFQLQNDLATELEQYAFFVLNGFLFEELAYRDLGNTFLRCVNLAAVPAIYAQSYTYYNLYRITVNQHIRQLYDIWWHRQQIDKCHNRIDMCRTVLDGDERRMEFLRQGNVAELSLTPDQLHATIRAMETEITRLERELATRLRATSVRNL